MGARILAPGPLAVHTAPRGLLGVLVQGVHIELVDAHGQDKEGDRHHSSCVHRAGEEERRWIRPGRDADRALSLRNRGLSVSALAGSRCLFPLSVLARGCALVRCIVAIVCVCVLLWRPRGGRDASRQTRHERAETGLASRAADSLRSAGPCSLVPGGGAYTLSSVRTLVSALSQVTDSTHRTKVHTPHHIQAQSTMPDADPCQSMAMGVGPCALVHMPHITSVQSISTRSTAPRTPQSIKRDVADVSTIVYSRVLRTT